MSGLLESGASALGSVRDLVSRARNAGPRPVRQGAMVAAVLVLLFVLDKVLPRGVPLGIILLGLVFGSLYALLAIGVVLIYRANRIVNFSQAEIGSVAAVLAIELVLYFRWNYFLAIIAGFIGAGVMGALINTLVIRRFRRAP